MIELPGYKLISELGRGGMARVYLALHEGLDRHVAIKIMYPGLSADTSFNDRFLREARIVARLDHPNIITVFDVNAHNGYQYIAMEYLPGESLGDKIKAGITPGKALSILKEISKGLKFAHDKGFLHRDIKPENILFKEDGTPVITDFGVARAEQSETQMTQAGTIIGTPHYMSPEQAQGQKINAASDIYSLGIVFHEMLTGVVPYRADSIVAIMYKHVNDPIPKLQSELKLFQSLLNKLLAKRVEDRYQCAGDIIKDIEKVELRIAPDLATRIMPARNFTAEDTLQETKKTTQRPISSIALKNPGMQKYIVIGFAFIFFTVASVITYTSVSKHDGELAEQKIERKNQQLAKDERRHEMERIRQEILKQEQEARERLAAEKAEQEKQRLSEQKQKVEREKLAAEKVREERKRYAAQKAKREQERANRAREEKLALQMRQKAQREKKLEQRIEKLIVRAESELAANNLSQAYNSYSKVLKIKSRHKHATQGVKKIAGRYLTLARQAAKTQSFDKADAFVGSAASVLPSHPEISSTRQHIIKLRDQKLASEKAQKQQDEKKTQRVFGGF